MAITRGGLILVEISFTGGARGRAGRFLGVAAWTGSTDLSGRLSNIKVKLMVKMPSND